MSNNLRPARSIRPGEIILDELEARGWTQRDLAIIIGRPPQIISEIIKGKKQITPQTAVELSAAFETSAELWMNLETNYRVAVAAAQADDERIKRLRLLYNLCPVAELQNRSWIRNTRNIDEIETDVMKLFGWKDLSYKCQWSAALRKGNWGDAETRALGAWLARATAEMRKDPLPVFRPKTCETLVNHLQKLMSDPSGIPLVKRELNDAGIHFSILRHLQKTYLDGATWMIEKNPAVCLSLRYNRIDAFWFTLMHEVAHVCLGHMDEVRVDDLGKKNPDAKERETDKVAREWILPQKEYKNFVRKTKPAFSEESIVAFASSVGRHPGIVLGALQFDKHVPYRNLRRFLVPVDAMLDSAVIEDGPVN